MLDRDPLVEYVRHGSLQPCVSLQIGAGAGFDAKLAGKTWISETTLDDTIRAYERVGGWPLYNIGLPDLSSAVPALRWRSERTEYNGTRIARNAMETPYGPLCFEFHEQPRTGVTPVRYPLDATGGLDRARWYAERHAEAAPYIAELLAPAVEGLHAHGPVSVQWPLQPFELFGLACTVDWVMMLMADIEAYRSLCDLIRDVNLWIIPEVVRAGADFIFLGGAAAEVLSPMICEQFLVPDSKALCRAVHEAGGLVYSHMCSPLEPFLSMGYYNDLGIDLFETLSPPPVGNVADLAAARNTLPAALCTRGNIGIDVLVQGSVSDVEAAVQRVLEAARGFKHMVAASDYLVYDIPLENAQAVVAAVEGG